MYLCALKIKAESSFWEGAKDLNGSPDTGQFCWDSFSAGVQEFFR